MFLVGATILILETEFRAVSRAWVIGLALVLMGLVTLEQVMAFVHRRHLPGS